MTWNRILSQVRALEARFRADGSLAWYRGERNAGWQLKSTIHRHVVALLGRPARPVPTKDRVELLRDEAKRIYRRFKADAWPLLRDAERSEWGVLFAMQHFGIPTRLLDWTESFACALFFAQHRRERGDAAAIWVLDPQALNRSSVQCDGLLAVDDDTAQTAIDPRAWHPRWKPPADPLPSVAAAPIFTNPRMVAQRSAFTLSGDSFQSLDRQHGGALVRQGRLVKIILPPATYDAAQDYLSLAGLGAFTYYPDLEGLALKHKAETDRHQRDAKHFYPRFFAGSRPPNKRIWTPPVK